MTQAWGSGENCMEWFETKLQAEAALGMWCWLLSTDLKDLPLRSLSCLVHQGAHSGASPVQLWVLLAL